MTKTDLTYKQDWLYTRFFPETAAGEDAWRQLAAQTEGTGAVLTIHAQSVIDQIRKAGYTVKKARKTKDEIPVDDLLAELQA